MAHNRHNRQLSNSALDLYQDYQHNLSTSSCRPPKPLQIRKQSSQHLPSTHSHHPLSDNNVYKKDSEHPIFPPRRSSMHKSNEFGLFEPENGFEEGHRHQNSDSSAIRTTMSSNQSNPFSIASIGDLPSRSVTRSTVSSNRPQYLSDASSGIIGNFVPIDDEMTMSGPLAEVTIPFREALSKNGHTYRAANPYEFEPDSPYLPNMRQTTFNDFIVDTRPSVSADNSQNLYINNAHSDSNTGFTVRATTPQPNTPSKANGQSILRSESSPNVSQGYGFSDRGFSPDLRDYHGEDGRVSPHQRGRAPSAPTQPRFQSQEDGNRDSLYDSFRVYSPKKVMPIIEINSQPPTRGRTRSPLKTLGDVEEADEADIGLETPTIPPKKRSRSPMKKMFGENGWLGKSPNELDPKNQSNKPRKDKISMMGKLRHKLEGLAEKADLSPISGSRSSREKRAKISVLSVSLGPPEQARIYMEVELMLVHTANVFLMLQFSQGRMAVDSIKKTVDGWKSRGRPVVIEFMYDQATQRDLVAANQNNFRFHGERAGDEMRISSMLYNWKNVASVMAIRTFCDADTVILKLLFDVEQILEFLGARDPILYRLQQIRVSSVEMMRISRQKKEVDSTSNIHGGRVYRDTMSSNNSSRAQSMEEPHVGTKVVADSYIN